MTTYAYISVASENRIARFRMDPESGTLEHVGDVEAEGGSAPLAVDGKKECLYAGLRGESRIGTFHINPSNGELSLVGTADLDSDPAYLFVDRSGKYLLSSYYRAGKAMVHAIGEDGKIGESPVSVQETEEHAHWIQTDPTNQYAFVPHTIPANAVYQFIFDETTGALTPNSQQKVDGGEGEGPRHIEFNPTRDFVFSSNENGSSITGYRFDPSEGRLSALQTLSTLPEGFEENNSTAQIHIHPSGNFIYVSNRGHNSIAGFAIAEDGGLTALDRTPTEPTPRCFNIDPSGNFLLVAGQRSVNLASYRIDTATGGLTPVETIAVGERLSWVLFLTLST